MSLFSILSTGAKGMQTSQSGAQLAGQNVSSASTDGYVRRNTNVQPDASVSDQPAGRRVVDQFVEKRLLGAQSSSADASAERFAVGPLDTAFLEDSGGVGAALDTFQAAVQTLAGKPEDDATRTATLAATGALAVAFSRTAATLDGARSDANHRIVDDVSVVNSRLKQIGLLNIEIQRSEANGSEASDLRDKRALLIRDVAEKVPVTVVESGRSSMSLLLNGSQALVGPDGRVNELGIRYAQNGDVTVTKTAAGMTIDVTSSMSSGSIGGELRARDGAIATAISQLDQLAQDISTSYNTVHAAGVALDGTGGRNLFTPSTTSVGAASRLSVSADVAGNPSLLAAATDPDLLPSDNSNALAMSSLASASLAAGGTTASEALASLVSGVGFAVQSATNTEAFTAGALAQMQELHESVSGVSTDEEMVSLMSYQRSYQASLKVVQVADDMLNILMQLRT